MKTLFKITLSTIWFILLTQMSFAQKKKTIKDKSGNIYKTVTIGTQTWMAENLKTEKFRNGDSIPYISDNFMWSIDSIGAYCYYNNNVEFKKTYGNLYNWTVINDNREICPKGWRVPDNSDWEILIQQLGGNSNAGNKMKVTDKNIWYASNTGSTNESGFSALAAGYRKDDGTFSFLHYYNYYWSSLITGNSEAYSWYLRSNFGYIHQNNGSRNYGYSVRCIKN